MRLLAISDLHVNNHSNRQALAALAPHPDDWLIVAGDVSENLAGIAETFDLLTGLFAKVIFVPGNHDLWNVTAGESRRGEARYAALVEIARERGVVTPDDAYPVWTGPGGPAVICPLFLLYDYSFRPAHVPLSGVVEWAREQRSVCADEVYLDPTPHRTRDDWCRERVRISERRLEAIPTGMRTVLVNHFPLRRDLVRIPRIPRFAPWCGTTLTEDWHRRFRASVVVSGHLHVRRTDVIDETRFEEVSLGYPRQWQADRGVAAYLRDLYPDAR